MGRGIGDVFLNTSFDVIEDVLVVDTVGVKEAVGVGVG